MIVGPVLVTVVAPRIAKLSALPSVGATWADAVWKGAAVNTAVSQATAASLADKPLNVFG